MGWGAGVCGSAARGYTASAQASASWHSVLHTAFADTDLLADGIVARMLPGLSIRRYEPALEHAGERVVWTRLIAPGCDYHHHPTIPAVATMSATDR